MTESASAYNPEFDPTGIEGGVDTNILPWLPVPGLSGVAVKPLRASMESGLFSVVMKINSGARLPSSVFLGGMDLMVLSGKVTYSDGDSTSVLEPGVWGYVSANTRIAEMVAAEDSELLMNFFNAVAFLNSDQLVQSILTSADIQLMARKEGITLVPSTLAACIGERPDSFSGTAEPLAIASSKNAGALVNAAVVSDTANLSHPHFIDCRSVPWAVNPDLPDIGLKILRVSQDTGVISLMVRHNGVATPHFHIGGADFLVLSGRIGYRAGPPEGYGPGMWFYEPPGARHEATQSLNNEDLIYTANVYGPLTFDSGRGTPVVAVLSWMEYIQLAEAGGAKLVPNTAPGDSTLLAWAPLKGAS